MKTKYKHIRFEKCINDLYDIPIKYWQCFNKQSTAEIGYIMFDNRFYQKEAWVFYPPDDCYGQRFDYKELQDIADFMKQLNEKEKQK